MKTILITGSSGLIGSEVCAHFHGEMGSRYLFICLYVWLEKYFSRGDYLRQQTARPSTATIATRSASDAP